MYTILKGLCSKDVVLQLGENDFGTPVIDRYHLHEIQDYYFTDEDTLYEVEGTEYNFILKNPMPLNEASTYKHLLSLGFEPSKCFYYTAAKRGWYSFFEVYTQSPELTLGVAAEHGNLDIVKLLVSQGVDIHEVDDYALRFASKFGHIEVVKYLLGKGANPNVRDNAPLRFAKQKGHIEIIKMLESYKEPV